MVHSGPSQPSGASISAAPLTLGAPAASAGAVSHLLVAAPHQAAPAAVPGASKGLAARMGHQRSFLQEVVIQLVAVGGLLLSLRFAMKYLDPYKEQREQAKKRAAFLNKVLGRRLELNEFEQLLAANVINPNHIDVELKDVSGLDDLIAELEIKVLVPMLHPEMYSTTLFKPARGVLLYGPPGTGKTMLAKALAKHSGCYFLNITASSIMSKWLGDANRLVRAIFSLAEKLQPCIIFIDEVDALLGKRGAAQEHEASLQVKTEFMQLWDGMESSRGQRVVVMGATNRPGMVDEAVLRRFSVQHEVGLPDAHQREAILRSYLRRHVGEVGQGAVAPELMRNTTVPQSAPLGALEWLAQRTDGFSGSDLMELCSQAAQRVLGEFWLEQSRRQSQATSQPSSPSTHSQPPESPPAGTAAAGAGAADGDAAAAMGPKATPKKLRAITLEDFVVVLPQIAHSTSKADEYTQRAGGSLSDPGLLLQLLARMAAAKPQGGAGNNNDE